MSERNYKAIRYACGCTADGDMVSLRCPIHGDLVSLRCPIHGDRDERELPEPGPIVPSPMLETMEGYDRMAWNYERETSAIEKRRKEIPR